MVIYIISLNIIDNIEIHTFGNLYLGNWTYLFSKEKYTKKHLLKYKRFVAGSLTENVMSLFSTKGCLPKLFLASVGLI